jgi:hypothetical protein
VRDLESDDFLAPLRASQSVAFTAMATWALQNYGDQPVTPLLRGMRLDVKAVRPGSLRIEDVTNETDMAPPILPGERTLNPWDVFVSDGERQLELARIGSRTHYDTGAAEPTLDSIESKHRLTVRIVPEVLFSTEPFEDVSAMGTQMIDGIPVLAYRFTDTGYDEEEEWWYVAADTGLPMRVSVLQVDEGACLVEMTRTDFSDWVIDPELPASTFDTTPPHDAEST